MKALHKAVESTERHAQAMRGLVRELKRSGRRLTQDEIAAEVIERVALAGYRSSLMRLPQRTLKATVRHILTPSPDLTPALRAAQRGGPVASSAFYRFAARVRQERRAMLGMTEPPGTDPAQDK